MRLGISTMQRFEGKRTVIFPYSMSCTAKRVGDYLLSGRGGVAKYDTPGFAFTLALLSREQAKVPVEGEE